MRFFAAILTAVVLTDSVVHAQVNALGETPNTASGESLGVACFYALGDNGLFAPREPISLALVLRNDAAVAISLEVMVRVKDFWGRPVMQRSFEVTAKERKTQRHSLRLPEFDKTGFYCVDAVVHKVGRSVVTAQCGFCVLPPEEKGDTYFGMDKNGMTKAMFTSFAKIGVGSIAAGVFWQGQCLDPKTRVRDVIKQQIRPGSGLGDALASGFQVVGYVSIDTPKTYEIAARRQQGLYPYPDSMFERFSETMEVVSELTRDRIKLWVVQQEIDARVGDPNAPAGSGACELATHVLLTRMAYKGLKKGNPGCHIAALGICCTDYFDSKIPFYLTRLILRDIKDHYEYLALDAYTPGWNGCASALKSPEAGSFRRLLVDATKLQKDFGKPQTIVNAEKGYAVAYHWSFDHPQNVQLANYTARSMILCKSVPSVIYYNLHMGTWDGLGARLRREKRLSTDQHPELDLGLWKNDQDESGGSFFMPRSAVAAYATTARLLSRTTNPEELALLPGVCCCLFQKQTQTLVAIWKTDGPAVAEIDTPTPAEHWDLMGNRTVFTPGRARLELGESPVFVQVEIARERLKDILKKMAFAH